MSAPSRSGSQVVDFEAYVAERRPALLRWARAVAGDPHTAEDLLQASLVRVLPRWGSIREGAAADAYVRRTITRQYVSWQREPRRREVVSAWLPEPPTSTPDLTDPRDAREVWGLVLALPARQRAAVALRFYEQLSVAETAEVLGCSTGTVKSNTSRGLAALRRLAADTALAG
ncbi:SigE family RNA polymerase sigma factor [Nocardioides eburneiflavus]|uniref:SigE family RNA polymerase sigma factor n=1 Tax=Nocardioides eburneiflavus TaxID=2518372 RepID=A0A4Z1CGH2_9ACTN|nr:SigE family RNA polymerase sigma factor [Nocardioides eburneiflavus]TGN64377.1 SigE family RNA polymerase sigma factor [Nocardioides eburneiflavus]